MGSSGLSVELRAWRRESAACNSMGSSGLSVELRAWRRESAACESKAQDCV